MELLANLIVEHTNIPGYHVTFEQKFTLPDGMVPVPGLILTRDNFEGFELQTLQYHLRTNKYIGYETRSAHDLLEYGMGLVREQGWRMVDSSHPVDFSDLEDPNA